MRVLSAAGNAALLGVLGAGAFFGYYTVRYSAEELQTVVHETHKPENQFVGSLVGHVSSFCKALAHAHECSDVLVFVGLGSCHGVVLGEPCASSIRNQKVPRSTIRSASSSTATTSIVSA